MVTEGAEATVELIDGVEQATNAITGILGKIAGKASPVINRPVVAMGGMFDSVKSTLVRTAEVAIPVDVVGKYHNYTTGTRPHGMSTKEVITQSVASNLLWHNCTSLSKSASSGGTEEPCRDPSANIDRGLFNYLRCHAVLQSRSGTSLIKKLKQRALVYKSENNMSDDCFHRVAPVSIAEAWQLSPREEMAMGSSLAGVTTDLTLRRLGSKFSTGKVWGLWDVATLKISPLTWAAQGQSYNLSD